MCLWIIMGTYTVNTEAIKTLTSIASGLLIRELTFKKESDICWRVTAIDDAHIALLNFAIENFYSQYGADDEEFTINTEKLKNILPLISESDFQLTIDNGSATFDMGNIKRKAALDVKGMNVRVPSIDTAEYITFPVDASSLSKFLNAATFSDTVRFDVNLNRVKVSAIGDIDDITMTIEHSENVDYPQNVGIPLEYAKSVASKVKGGIIISIKTDSPIVIKGADTANKSYDFTVAIAPRLEND